MGEESQWTIAGLPGAPGREGPPVAGAGGAGGTGDAGVVETSPVDLLRRRVERIRLRADRILEELEARYGSLPPTAPQRETGAPPDRASSAGRVLSFRR